MRFLLLTLAFLAAQFLVPHTARAEAPPSLRLTIGHEELLIDLWDNPAAWALAAQLPLTLPFKDYVGEEKIATLPQRLPTENSPTGRENPTDFTYFAPWGNLAIFYKGLGDSGQVLALGRIRTGKTLLGQQRGNFEARLELIP